MALIERLQKTTQVGYWTGEIPLEYVYTYGRAGEAYFRNLMDKGTFLGARCGKCGITYVPPRTYCEKCFDRLEGSYVDVPATGTVHTYTVLHKNLDGSDKKDPAIMAVIRLDNTDGGVVHHLGGVKPEEVSIGMKVKAVLKPKKDRKGAISDIKHFMQR
ncbi:MAG: Zn-ribbon domain-containing OB-fold protein [Desulfobacterales bacterium]|nr:Zn-ribbon domain-containing OB-fold protein [Desulfobacterales bacterium]